MAWVDRTSDAYWIAAYGASWNPGGWWDVPGTAVVILQDVGFWAVGFRPTMIRMTYSGGNTVTFFGRDATPSTIWTQGSYASGASVAITWGAEDLYELRWNINKGPAAQITKIEFLEIATTTTTTTTSITTTTTATSTSTTTTTTSPAEFEAPFDFFGEWTEPITTTTTTATWPPGVCVEEERYDPRWTENYFYSDWPQEYTFQSDHSTRLDNCGTFKPHGTLGYYPGDFEVDMRFELSRDMRTGGVDSDYIGLVANIEGLRAVSIVLTSETNQQKARRLDSDGCVFSENYGNLYLPTEVWLRISRTDSDFFTYYSYDRIKWYEVTALSPQTYSGLVTIHFGAYHRTGGNQFEARYQFWTLWPDGPSWLESGAYLPHLIESDNFDDNDLNERWFKRHGTYFRPTPFFAEGCIWEADQVMKVQTSPYQFHGPYNEFEGTWAWQDVKGFFNLTVKVMVNPALTVDEVEMGIIARELPAEGEPSCRVIYTRESGTFYFKRVDTAGDGSESETSIGAGILSEFWLGLRWYKDGFTASYSLNGVNWDPIAAPAVPIAPTNWLQVGCAAKGWISPAILTSTTTTTTTTMTTTTSTTTTTTTMTTTTTTGIPITTTTTVPPILFIVPDADDSQSGMVTFGAGTGGWDRMNSGIISGTPDDTNGIYGLNGGAFWRFQFENPSFAGTSTNVLVRVRAKDFSSGPTNFNVRLYSDGVSQDDFGNFVCSGSYQNFTLTPSSPVTKTAAQLTNLEVRLEPQDGSFDTQFSEVEVEVVLPTQTIYDDFGDGVIDPKWSIIVGAQQPVEAASVWTITQVAGDGTSERGQPFTYNELDVYGQISSSYTGLGASMLCLFDIRDNSTNHIVRIGLDGNTGAIKLYYLGSSVFNFDSNTLFIFQDFAWVRIRYKPSLGDTKMRLFYALSAPGAWTEITLATSTPVLTSGNYSFRIIAADSHGSFNVTWVIDDAIEWTQKKFLVGTNYKGDLGPYENL